MCSFTLKYRILPPLLALVGGILIADSSENGWLLAVLLAPALGAVTLIKTELRFLLFIPAGIVLSANSELPENHISRYIGKRLDVEGVLYRSPETRERGSRLFLDVGAVFIEGRMERASGKLMLSTEGRIGGLFHGDRIRALDVKLRPFKNFLNPGNFDIERFYRRKGLNARGFVPGENSIISFGKGDSSSFFLHYVDRLRLGYSDFLRRDFPAPESEILSVITVGDKGAIPVELREEFSKAGTAHLLAISGLHVGAVAFVFYFLIKWILKRSEYLLLRFRIPRLAAFLTILPVLTYTALAGFATPAIRASVMVSLYLVAVVLGREDNKMNILGVAAFIILLLSPEALFELSFRLSFISVLGILIVHKFYPLEMKTPRDKLLSAVKTTVAATFATLPFIINSFGTIPLISVPANLIFVPLVEILIVPLGLISILIFSLSETVSSYLVSVNIELITGFIRGTDMLLQIPLSSLTVPPLNKISLALYGLTAAIFVLIKEYPKLKFAIPFLLLALVSVSAYRIIIKPTGDSLELHFLDAGSRNLVFVKLPNSKTVLFDGGFSYFDGTGYIERAVLSPFLLESRITEIDYLLLGSPDRDHLKGTQYLLRKFDVKKLWTNGEKLNGPIWKIIHEGKLLWKNVSAEVEDFEAGGVKIEFFMPRGEFEIWDSGMPYPLILKLSFGEVSFLFGEALQNKSVQKELLVTYGNRIGSSVLYIPEISRRFGTNIDFVGKASPLIVVVNSADQNPLKLLNSGRYKNSIRVFQTKVQGTVTVLTDGKGIRVKTFTDDNEEVLH